VYSNPFKMRSLVILFIVVASVRGAEIGSRRYYPRIIGAHLSTDISTGSPPFSATDPYTDSTVEPSTYPTTASYPDSTPSAPTDSPNSSSYWPSTSTPTDSPTSSPYWPTTSTSSSPAPTYWSTSTDSSETSTNYPTSPSDCSPRSSSWITSEPTTSPPPPQKELIICQNSRNSVNNDVGNYGDLICAAHAHPSANDVLLVRDTIINYDEETSLNYDHYLDDVVISTVNVLNYGREHAFTTSVTITNEQDWYRYHASVQVNVKVPSLEEVRMFVEIYGRKVNIC
jgi:hypothetical protein